LERYSLLCISWYRCGNYGWQELRADNLRNSFFYKQLAVKKVFQGFIVATMRRSMRRNPMMILRGTMTGDLSGVGGIFPDIGVDMTNFSCPFFPLSDTIALLPHLCSMAQLLR